MPRSVDRTLPIFGTRITTAKSHADVCQAGQLAGADGQLSWRYWSDGMVNSVQTVGDLQHDDVVRITTVDPASAWNSADISERAAWGTDKTDKRESCQFCRRPSRTMAQSPQTSTSE